MASPSLRELTRDSVRAQIAAVAVRRFDEDGFDAVTVEQVAAEAGISARSFHRYFPAKEDAVIGDPAPHGRMLRDLLGERPTDEHVWDALRAAFTTMTTRADLDEDLGRRSVRVMTAVPSLRARNLEKHLLWADLLRPEVARRLGVTDDDLRAAVVVRAALACFDLAVTAWASEDGQPSIADLLERTFADLVVADR